jgi:hypothetical protein
VFIDYEKAFDRVDRNKLWAILHNKAYPQHLINTIKVLLTATFAYTLKEKIQI